ncbi:MAG: hypothetical protein ACQEQL_08735 [Pseudomonadota bacterium]
MKNTGEKRPLTAGEIQLARTIFGEKLDYDKITVVNRRFGLLAHKNGGRTFMNTLNASGTANCADFSKEGPGKQAFFLHEMTHIWQYQSNCLDLTKKVIKDVAKHNFNYHSTAYMYHLDEKMPFEKYGHEQQASIVEDFFLLSRHGLISRRERCQNTGISAKERLALYQKILAPHFPIATRPQPGQISPRNIKP